MASMMRSHHGKKNKNGKKRERVVMLLDTFWAVVDNARKRIEEAYR